MLTEDDKKKILDLKKEYSIYAPWTDKDLFQKIVDDLAQPFKDLQVDKVLGLEARGFILGAAVAYKLHTGFVVARKGGSMYKDGYAQNDVMWEECVDYSGKKKILEIEKHGKGIQKGDKAIIIDDWFEKGGQGQAAIKLVEKAGGDVVGIGVMIDQMKEEIRQRFTSYNFHSLVNLDLAD